MLAIENSNRFASLSDQEMMSIDGGIFPIVILGVSISKATAVKVAVGTVVVAAAAAIGYYNGYYDTKK